MTNKEKSTAEFTAKIESIKSMLDRIQSAADDHFYASPEDITWGHVGTVTDYESTLREISDQIFHEGEYAV